MPFIASTWRYCSASNLPSFWNAGTLRISSWMRLAGTVMPSLSLASSTTFSSIIWSSRRRLTSGFWNMAAFAAGPIIWTMRWT